MAFDFKVKRFLRGLSYPAPYWNPVWLSPVEPGDMAALLNEPVAIEDVYSEVLECWEAEPAGNMVDRTLEFYTRFYLQDDVLLKVDRASMMNSLETRAVFLDNDLVEFCQRLPARFKFANGTGKILLRRALRGVVPDEVLDRPKKGFGVPMSRWLREITPPEGHDLPAMRTGAVRRLWERHAGGVADERLALWCCLSLHHHMKNMQGDVPEMAVAS
jgi:asparagine synthase (glutamine-hydrolysing)